MFARCLCEGLYHDTFIVSHYEYKNVKLDNDTVKEVNERIKIPSKTLKIKFMNCSFENVDFTKYKKAHRYMFENCLFYQCKDIVDGEYRTFQLGKHNYEVNKK